MAQLLGAFRIGAVDERETWAVQIEVAFPGGQHADSEIHTCPGKAAEELVRRIAEPRLVIRHGAGSVHRPYEVGDRAAIGHKALARKIEFLEALRDC